MSWRTWRDRMGFGFADERIPGVPWEHHIDMTERIVSEQKADIALLTQRLALWMRIADRDYRALGEAKKRLESASEAHCAAGRLQDQLFQREQVMLNMEHVNREQAQEIDRLHDRVRVLQEAAKRRRRR